MDFVQLAYLLGLALVRALHYAALQLWRRLVWPSLGLCTAAQRCSCVAPFGLLDWWTTETLAKRWPRISAEFVSRSLGPKGTEKRAVRQ